MHVEPLRASRSRKPLDECAVKLIDPEKVNRVREVLPDQGVVIELADVFSLLADPGRMRLLVALLEAGELCVCDLAATTEMTESAVSHALRLLRARRVVSVSRRDPFPYYRLDDAHVRMLLDLGLTHAGHTTAPNAKAAADLPRTRPLRLRGKTWCWQRLRHRSRTQPRGERRYAVPGDRVELDRRVHDRGGGGCGAVGLVGVAVRRRAYVDRRRRNRCLVVGDPARRPPGPRGLDVRVETRRDPLRRRQRLDSSTAGQGQFTSGR